MKTSKRAYTLVELMVVLGGFVALTSLLFGVLQAGDSDRRFPNVALGVADTISAIRKYGDAHRFSPAFDASGKVLKQGRDRGGKMSFCGHLVSRYYTTANPVPESDQVVDFQGAQPRTGNPFLINPPRLVSWNLLSANSDAGWEHDIKLAAIEYWPNGKQHLHLTVRPLGEASRINTAVESTTWLSTPGEPPLPTSGPLFDWMGKEGNRKDPDASFLYAGTSSFSHKDATALCQDADPEKDEITISLSIGNLPIETTRHLKTFLREQFCESIVANRLTIGDLRGRQLPLHYCPSSPAVCGGRPSSATHSCGGAPAPTP